MRAILLMIAIAGCSRHGASTVHVGTVFESETVTRLQKPFDHETTGTIKETILAMSETEMAVQIEISDGSTRSAQVVKMPLRQEEPKPCPGTSVATSHEKCTTDVGTFDCTRTTVEVHTPDTTNSTVTWTAKDIPVPIKSVVMNANLTTTTELVALRP